MNDLKKAVFALAAAIEDIAYLALDDVGDADRIVRLMYQKLQEASND